MRRRRTARGRSTSLRNDFDSVKRARAALDVHAGSTARLRRSRSLMPSISRFPRARRGRVERTRITRSQERLLEYTLLDLTSCIDGVRSEVNGDGERFGDERVHRSGGPQRLHEATFVHAASWNAHVTSQPRGRRGGGECVVARARRGIPHRRWRPCAAARRVGAVSSTGGWRRGGGTGAAVGGLAARNTPGRSAGLKREGPEYGPTLGAGRAPHRAQGCGARAACGWAACGWGVRGEAAKRRSPLT